jgi:proline dehydrogenase
MAFLKLSTSRKCSQLLLQESLRNDLYTRLVRSLTTTNGSGELQQQQQQRRNNSVAATAASTVDNKPKWDTLDTSFANPEATFKSKTTWEIFRAYIVYQLCSSNYLVENNMQVNV